MRVFNQYKNIANNGWKLAHLEGVNGKYKDIDYKNKSKEIFDIGDRNEWNNKNKIRYVEGFTQDDKNIIIAHFLRLVHPCNYILVPLSNNCISRLGKDISEYSIFIDYIRAIYMDMYGEIYKEFQSLAMSIDTKNSNVNSNGSEKIDLICNIKDLNKNHDINGKIGKLAIVRFNNLITNDKIKSNLMNFENCNNKKDIDYIKLSYNEIYEKVYKEIQLLDTSIGIKNINNYENVNKKIDLICNIENLNKYDDKIEKIGALARRTFNNLIKDGKITPEMVSKLMDVEYCKNTIGIKYPILKKRNNTQSMKEQVKIGKYNRYWKDELMIGSEYFYMCKEWYQSYEEKLMNWIDTVV